jgi:hypothetical protein
LRDKLHADKELTEVIVFRFARNGLLFNNLQSTITWMSLSVHISSSAFVDVGSSLFPPISSCVFYNESHALPDLNRPS